VRPADGVLLEFDVGDSSDVTLAYWRHGASSRRKWATE